MSSSISIRSNARGFTIHFLIPIIAVIGVTIIGTLLIHDSRAASTPYSGPCTPTIINTSTKVTTTKYKDCILQAQELMDAVEREDYKNYHTAIETVPETFVSGTEHYLTMNGVYSTATAYAVKTLPGNGTSNQLTNNPTSGTWQIVCSDAVNAGLATGGTAANYTLTINKNVSGEYSKYTNASTFAATCGNLPTSGTTGNTTLTPTGADCWGDVVGGGTCYYWVGAYQNDNNNFTATGVSSNFTQAEPTDQATTNGDNHTLIETYVSSSDGKESLEIGWFVSTNTGKAPVLMVTHWINGAFIGYTSPSSADGFVQVSSSIKPLSTPLQVGVTGNYKIQVANNQWQFWYNGAEVGYFPESLWTSQGITFNKIQWVSDYGEVATHVGALSQVGMGNGILGSASGSTAVSGYTLYGSSTPADFNSFYEPQGAVTTYYDDGATSATGFRLGGPGID